MSRKGKRGRELEMRNKLTLAIVLAAATALVSIGIATAVNVNKLTYPPLGKIEIPKVERVELANGMILMLVEDHELPLVNFRALVRAGEVFGTGGNAALANVFDEVQRTGGTEKMTGDEIDQVLESIGASVETSLGTSSGSVTAQFLGDQIDTVLPIFADILMHPRFRQEKIDLAKTQLRSVVARRNDDSFGIMQREFGKLLYGADSPYASQMEYSDLKALKRQELLSFHSRYYHPNGIILGIWGDFNTDAMRSKVTNAFSSWQRSAIDYPPLPEIDESVAGSVNYIEKTDIEQALVLFGHLSVRWDNPDLPKIQIMNSILGSGFTSRIFRIIRTEKGLAYAAGGRISPAFDHPGTFFSFCSTKFATTHEALTAMQDVIKDFREGGVTEEELTVAKDHYLNSFAFQFDSTGEVLGRLMTYEYYGYPADFLQNFRKGVDAVTQADILEVARKYIHPDDMIILVIGDDSRFDAPLTDLGQIAEIDISIPEPRSDEVIALATPEALARGRQLTDKTIGKLGGPGPFAKVKTLVLNSSITMMLPQGEMEISGVQTMILPDRMYLEIKAPFGKVIQVLNGETGWTSTPQGVSSLPAQQAEMMGREARFQWIPLFQKLASDEVELQSLGSIQFEERKAEDIYLTFSDGTTAHLYIDAADFTPLGIRRMGSTMQGPAEILQLLSDFREVGQVMMPFSIKVETDGKVIQEVQISEILLNTSIDESIFVMPKD